jgi:hypothetical protein
MTRLMSASGPRNGHSDRADGCLLSGVSRKHLLAESLSAFNPERTFVALLVISKTALHKADLVADFRVLRAAVPLSEGRLGGTNRLRRDLARNIAAYPAFLPILLSLQEGLFSSLYLARFSRNQR